MKFSLFSKVMILAFAVALSASAFAGADSHKASFQISDPVEVNGKQLPAGDYVAKWDGSGPDVQVSIVRDGKTVATVPAKVVQLNEKSADDVAEVKNGASSRELSALRFSGKKYSLELNNSSTQAMKADNPSTKK